MERRPRDLRNHALLAGGLVLALTSAPGHLDRDGLQVALVLGGVVSTVRPPSQGAGFALGLLAAVSLVAGWAAIPLFAVLAAAAIAEWGVGGGRDRLIGLAIGAVTGLAIDRGLFGAVIRDLPAYDGLALICYAAAITAGAVWGMRRYRPATGIAPAPLRIVEP